MTRLSIVAPWIAALLLSSLSQAQVATKKTLTDAGAQRVLHATILAAKINKTTGVIAVVDDGGNLMALERLDGAVAADASTSIDKARAAALSARPAMAATSPGVALVILDGQVVGAVGVSGAASSLLDEALAKAGAAALSSGPPPATFIDQAKVQAAFAKGAPLFDASEKYEIRASRREEPGPAEIHVRDADLMYVLEGTATVVTGGTLVDQTTASPDELRGREISGGETRQFSKGDVLVIPAGVAHWFKEVSNPFLYYVVKAR